MKGERSFACGQGVRTDCYMAIVQGYVCMYMYMDVHASVQGYLRMYAYTSMYYAVGDRTYVHIDCARTCVSTRAYVCIY